MVEQSLDGCMHPEDTNDTVLLISNPCWAGNIFLSSGKAIYKLQEYFLHVFAAEWNSFSNCANFLIAIKAEIWKFVVDLWILWFLVCGSNFSIHAGKACNSARSTCRNIVWEILTRNCFHGRELIIKTNMSLVNYSFSTRIMMKSQRFSTIVAFKSNAFCQFSSYSPLESWSNKEILQEQRPASRQPLDGCKIRRFHAVNNKPKKRCKTIFQHKAFFCLSRFKTVLLMSCLTKRFWLNYLKISACRSNQLGK